MPLQTEKQRLIWAYKILFLDVLFPLNLPKVIFCDSDQVVRGDMAELWNMDLKVGVLATVTQCNCHRTLLMVSLVQCNAHSATLTVQLLQCHSYSANTGVSE